MKHQIRLICRDDLLERMITLLLTDRGYTVSASAAHCPAIVDLDSAELPRDKKNAIIIGITRYPDAAEMAAKAQKCRILLSRPINFNKLFDAVDDAIINGELHSYSPPRTHRAPDITLNTTDLTLSCGGRQVRLTPGEAALFSVLSENRGDAVSYEALSAAVGGSDSNKVEVHICALRRKLGQIYSRPLITTVRGQGYKIQ